MWTSKIHWRPWIRLVLLLKGDCKLCVCYQRQKNKVMYVKKSFLDVIFLSECCCFWLLVFNALHKSNGTIVLTIQMSVSWTTDSKTERIHEENATKGNSWDKIVCSSVMSHKSFHDPHDLSCDLFGSKLNQFHFFLETKQKHYI